MAITKPSALTHTTPLSLPSLPAVRHPQPLSTIPGPLIPLDELFPPSTPPLLPLLLLEDALPVLLVPPPPPEPFVAPPSPALPELLLGEPVHTPDMQAPPAQGEPSALAGLVQAPVVGSQEPASWHWS